MLPSAATCLTAWHVEILGSSPRDICSVVNNQAGIVLMVGHFEVCLEAVSFGVPDICSVEEGTEEEEG